jgi:hypothetical protein
MEKRLCVIPPAFLCAGLAHNGCNQKCQELLKTGPPSEIETSRGGAIRFGGIIMESVHRAGDFAQKNVASISGCGFSGGFDPRLPAAGTHGEIEALTGENSEI